MVIKNKFLCTILIFFITCSIYAQSKYDGIWVSRSTYNDIILSSRMNNFVISKNDFSWENAKYYPNISLEIDSKQDLFCTPELAGVKLIKIEEIGKKSIIYLDKYYEENNYHWNIQLIINEINDNIISFETEDEILNSDYSEFKTSVYWYKISSPPSIPLEYAELNDSKVRVRTEPNLSCDTWGYVNKNDLVILKDRSLDKFEIDGQSYYWYKVESEYLPDGWVYGKYLNKMSKEDYEKRIDLKNNLTVSEHKLSKLEIIQNVSNVISNLKNDAKRERDDKKNVVYSESKSMYRYYGTSYDEKKDILVITDNRYSYKHNLTNDEIILLLGKPDEDKSNMLIYNSKYGKLWLYTLTLYLKNDCLEKIELRKEQSY